MNLRTLIVDDEPLARDRLRAWLESEPEVTLVGECGDGRQAVALIKKEKPDLLFLDVQMPEMDGFAVIEALGQEVPPAVVFATAYDQFAVKAFEVHAVDYLLKPFDRNRMRAAIERVRQRLARQNAGAFQQQLANLMADLRPADKGAPRLAVKTEGRVLLVKTAEIDWIEAADNYVVLHSGGHRHLLRETMNALEERLDPARFVRVSRSAIVNVDQVRELQPLFHGEQVLLLKDGSRVTLTRNYRDQLKRLGVV